MAIPEPVESSLELAAARVLQMRDANFFIGDTPVNAVMLSTSPKIELRKTGGTTGHREQGGSYINYRLRIPELNIRYSIYVTHAADDSATNQRTLARAIRWFIVNYGNGAVFSRDEPAT